MIADASAAQLLQQELTNLLDACDAIADHIDEWSEQKLNTHELEAAYEKTVFAIEMLQDACDESD